MTEGRRLVIGGVEISHTKALLGNSDADRVLHAITGALLGATGLPDIGHLSPDTDPAYKNADGRALLRDAMERIPAAGFTMGNVDVILHAEAPKMSPHKKPVAESVASLLDLPSDCVSVKAKTSEGLGPLGFTDAIVCTAVALLSRDGSGK